MKVLVTGSSGNVGRYTVRELAGAGHEVTALDRVLPGRSEREPGVKGYPCDLADYGEVADLVGQVRPEAVCHLAALPAPNVASRTRIFNNNVSSTFHVLQAAGEFGVRRFIYASSEMAAGWPASGVLPPEIPFTEEHRRDSRFAYALSKYLGEVMADSSILRYPEMAICSLRINRVLLPDRYAEFLPQMEDLDSSAGFNYWSYVDVRDVASAFRAALEGRSEGHEVFNVAAADSFLDRPVAEAIEIRYGEKPNLRPDHGPNDSCVDCSKMKRFFGWEPRHSWREAE